MLCVPACRDCWWCSEGYGHGSVNLREEVLRVRKRRKEE